MVDDSNSTVFRDYLLRRLSKNEPGVSYAEECRCTIGEDHEAGEDGPLSNNLSATDAENIWLSSGMDGDYDFR